MKRLLDLVFGASKRNDLRLTDGKPQSKIKRRQLKLESLENRRVFDVEFGSVIGIGNGETSSVAFDVAADSVGNRYVAGYFSGTVDFDPSSIHSGDVDILMSRGTTDSYVAKYAPDDSLLWVRRMGGDSIQDDAAAAYLKPDKASKVEVDSAGNVYVVGGFAGSSDFGSFTLTSNGDANVYTAKLNSNGTFQWAKSWGGSQDDVANGVDVDSSGNVYVTAGPASRDLAIIKYTASGSLSWDKRITTNFLSGSMGIGMATDSSGNVYVAGSFAGTVDFDPGSKTKLVTATSSGGVSAYVVKLNSQGNFGWVSAFQSGSQVMANALAVDAGGSVLVGGYYRGSVDFNPGSGVTTLGGQGGFMTKLTNSGSLVWAKSLASNLYNTALEMTFVRDIGLDSAGSIYATGQFNGSIDLDPSASGVVAKTTNGDMDIFLVKLTSAGAYQWSETFGGVGYDYATMAIDGSSNIHLAGYFQYSVDFDAGAGESTLSSNGTAFKGFLKKLRQV